MSRIELIAPCHFGLESVLKKEILDLGYEIVQVEDGRITFAGEEDAVARANMFIRTAERIMIKCGSFKNFKLPFFKYDNLNCEFKTRVWQILSNFLA